MDVSESHDWVSKRLSESNVDSVSALIIPETDSSQYTRVFFIDSLRDHGWLCLLCLPTVAPYIALHLYLLRAAWEDNLI